MPTKNHNQTLPTLASAGSALLKADDAMHSAQQAAACAIMLAVEEGKIALPGGFGWASYMRDATTNEAKEFNKRLREGVSNAFASYRDADPESEQGLELKGSLQRITSKMIVAAKNAAALYVMGCTTHDYREVTKGRLAFYVPVAAMTPRDDKGKPLNGFFQSIADALPINNRERNFFVSGVESDKRKPVKFTLANVVAQAAIIAGKSTKKRTKRETADTTAQSLAASPIGLASLLSQAGATMVGEDGTPSKTLRENGEVNAEAASLLSQLMVAFGVMLVHDDANAAPQFKARRALEVYEAARDGNSVDLIAH